MDYDGDDFGAKALGQGARMVIAAVVSAVVTATVVITLGQAMLERHAPLPTPSHAVLIRTSG